MAYNIERRLLKFSIYGSVVNVGPWQGYHGFQHWELTRLWPKGSQVRAPLCSIFFLLKLKENTDDVELNL